MSSSFTPANGDKPHAEGTDLSAILDSVEATNTRGSRTGKSIHYSLPLPFVLKKYPRLICTIPCSAGPLLSA